MSISPTQANALIGSEVIVNHPWRSDEQEEIQYTATLLDVEKKKNGKWKCRVKPLENPPLNSTRIRWVDIYEILGPTP